MAENQKHGLHTVEVDSEELNKKIRAHRRKLAAIVFFILLLFVIAAVALYFYFQNKVYDSYEVLSTLEREDDGASGYESFQGNLIRYTNDGAVYTDVSGTQIWNQPYEMEQPAIETRGDYVAIYERGGNQVYILNTVNLQGSVQTTAPIQKVSVAKQGTVAILMENDGTSYLQLYDKTGETLASGELHVQNSGYPLDLSLSEDGEKLAVSMLDIQSGTVKTTIAFYNFGAVGQNSIDKIVSSYSYEDVVIPQLRYLSGDTLVAFGDDRMILFTGAQKPAESKTIELSEQVRSIFYNEEQFGLISEEEKLSLYDSSGALTQQFQIEVDDGEAEILESGELCIRGEKSCAIYNAKGICKFSCQFDQYLYQVLSTNRQTEYVFLLEGETQKVKLK